MQRPIVSQHYSALADLIILLLVGATIYGVITMGAAWQADFQPATRIDLSVWALPKYTLLSGIRGLVAYFISLCFTLVVGYTAAKSPTAERVIIPTLDILQSIPPLGFMPGLVLGLIALFPNSNMGLELTAVLMIFTGQVWNMTFSFYSSLKSLPSDFREASTVIGLSWYQKLTKVELPFSAVNLAWNSLLSMAGGWFFLSICEAFTLGKQEYRLPGLGAYVAVAVADGNTRAILSGVAAMILLIVTMDFLIWRPILAWVQRFRLEEVPGAAPAEPLMRVVIRESRILRAANVMLRRYTADAWKHHPPMVTSSAAEGGADGAPLTLAGELPSGQNQGGNPGKVGNGHSEVDDSEWERRGETLHRLTRWLMRARSVRIAEFGVMVVFSLAVAWGAWRLLLVLLSVEVALWITILRNTFWTFLRVAFSLTLSTLWAVPVGIWIGTSSRRIRIAQPLIQIFASFPAPMLYPLILAILFKLGVSFDWASMFLMMMGVQWYVLFNVLAGALRIPRELGYALSLMESSAWDRWRTLYIPSVFPALVTGWVTAAGGAWNASMVAEYMAYAGQVLETGGLGAMITAATAAQNMHLLAASLFVMVVMVVLLNRVLWSPLYRLAQTRYRMDL